MRKWMRNYLLAIQIPENNEVLLIGDSYWYLNRNDLTNWEYSDLLTCKFDVTRKAFAQSQESSFQIYNLNPSHRQQIYQAPYQYDRNVIVEFYAGYGKNLYLICKGRVFEAYSYKSSNDVITNIHVVDLGFNGYYTLDKNNNVKPNNHSMCSFNAGMTKREAIELLVKDMPNIKLGNIGEINGKFETNVSFDGNTFDIISEITEGHAFIDNGVLNILANREAIVRGDLPLLNADSGLLGTPKRREAILELDLIFDPTINVGYMCEINSLTGAEYNGQYKCTAIKHSGTISTAVCDNCTTSLELLTGGLIPATDGNLMPSYTGDNQQKVTYVKGQEVEPASGKIPKGVQEVYNYTVKNGTVPSWNIGNTNIKWNKVVKAGIVPSLAILSNLHMTATNVYEVIYKNFGRKTINISSGYRTSSNNSSVGGSSTSNHLKGLALDITSVSGVSKKQLFQVFEAQTQWKNRQILEEDRCVHVDCGTTRRGGASIGYTSKSIGWKIRPSTLSARDV